MPRNIFGLLQLGKGVCYRWIGAKNATKNPTVHRTALHNYAAKNINSANVEKS